MIRQTRQFILTLLVLTSLTGCSLFIGEGDDIDALELAKELLKGQLDEHGVQKNIHLPLRVNYSVSRKPMIDEELTVEFEFIAEQALPVLRFAVVTDDGLELVSNNIRDYYQGVAARQVIKRRIVVVPKSENEFYINLYIVTEIGDDKRARLIKIPIALGDYSLKKTGAG